MSEGAAAGRAALAEELRALGGLLQAQPTEDLADRVLARIEAAPAARWPRHARRPRTALAGWQRAAAVVAALLLAVGLAAAVSPQVRAAIGEVFRFGGIEVRPGSGPTPAPTPAPPLPGEHRADLAGAAAEAGFPVRVPAALGPPAEVTVTDGRVVSLRYPAAGRGPVRLDQFAGTLGVMWEKYTNAGLAQPVDVGGLRGLWFALPVDLVYVDRSGREHPESARRTTATLVWTDGELTFRLDGIAPVEAAVAVARSMR